MRLRDAPLPPLAASRALSVPRSRKRRTAKPQAADREAASGESRSRKRRKGALDRPVVICYPPHRAGEFSRWQRYGGRCMRVLLNGMASVGARTGIGHYTGELLRRLREQAGPESVDFFPPPWLATIRRFGGRWSMGGGGGTRRASPGVLSRCRARLATAGRAAFNGLVANRFQAACRSGGYDLYHEPNVVPFESNLPTVTTVHDLSVLLHPQWHPAHRVAWYEKYFAAGIARSQLVLTVSEFARREIIETLGLSPDRVIRTYNGIRPNLGPLPGDEVQTGLRALGLPPRYLLLLGTLEPRKNIPMLLRAYGSLPAWLRERLSTAAGRRRGLELRRDPRSDRTGSPPQGRHPSRLPRRRTSGDAVQRRSGTGVPVVL